MPEFKIKNLMIDVLSPAVPDLDKLCRIPTDCLLTKECPRKSFCRLPTFPECPGWRTWTFCPYDTQMPCNQVTILCRRSDWIYEETIGCDGSSRYVVIDVGGLITNPAAIDEVRDDLNQVLEVAAVRGADLAKAMQPQTLAQAEVLEAHITEALEEVQKLKQRLK